MEMDDSCAVCADSLEWVAYGPCGHRDVCSTCVARLRFICNDRRCCICKTDCNIVFVTKALGDYTKMVDFTSLPSNVREGQMEPYWYHEDTQAFFDDVDHYKMIKAMCRLSCSVCDNNEEHDGSRRWNKFRNIDQLKGHLFHRHKLLMCSLCLEGRKVFICEQKLYTRGQLNQHINTGDSEVDGTESERGGFMGHPMCEFCGNPFYGDNELYTHMSTEHYTCHICQRLNPGQYEYYRNYDDLEIHFRQGHFLCEDEACLAKKFIVFQSESELKRHNALEHGGRMSRSKRNAVLQIPTSFRYRRSHEPGYRRGRARTFRSESSPDDQLSMAIQASLEAVDADGRLAGAASSNNAVVVPDSEGTGDIDPLIQPFESLATSDSDIPSRYLQAVSHNSRTGPLEESSFPPLPMAPNNSSQQRSLRSTPQNNMAARIRRKSNVTVLNTAQARAPTSRWPAPSSSSSIPSRPVVNNVPASSSGSGQSNLDTTVHGPTSSWPAPSASSSAPPRPKVNSVPASSSGPGQSNLPTTVHGPAPPPSYASSVQVGPTVNNGFALGSTKMSRSASASSLAESRSFDPISDFPPVSEIQSNRSSSSNQAAVKVEDVQTANKSLVEKIRDALEHDEDKYAAFKEISQEYRQGSVDTSSYLHYVKQFGLSHLVLDMARLLPDAQKRRELLQKYNDSVDLKQSGSSGKAKGKDAVAEDVLTTVRRLQSSYKPSEEVEVLEKDGYRASKWDLGVAGQTAANLNSQKELQSAGNGISSSSGDGGGVSKRGKKTSKFHRIRLGDGSAAALVNPRPEATDDVLTNGQDNLPSLVSPARGAWRSGGGQKLFGAPTKGSKK